MFVADSVRVGMSQFSKYKSGLDTYTSHYEDETRFVEDIIDICNKRDIHYIFPSHNETEILARHKKEIGENLCVLMPDSGVCGKFNDKDVAGNIANSLGVPVPGKLIYKNPAEISAAVNRAGYKETVIKLRKGNSAKGVYYADSPASAQETAKKLIQKYKLPPNRFPVIEERVNGEGWGVSVLYWHGELIADFTHRRLREKISSGGTSTLRVAADMKELRDAAVKVFNHVGWHGLAMMEFKVCPDTGKFWFIEVNPRLWGSLPLAIASGAEFPYLAHLCYAKGSEAAKEYDAHSARKEGHVSRWLLGDLFLALASLVKLNPLRASQIMFGEKADSIDDFHVDDANVFVGELGYYLYSSLGSLSLNPEKDGMLG